MDSNSVKLFFNLIKWHLEFEHISNQLILDMAYPIIPSNIRMSITMAIHFILRSESNWNTFKIRRNIMRIVPNIPIFHKASWVDNVFGWEYWDASKQESNNCHKDAHIFKCLVFFFAYFILDLNDGFSLFWKFILAIIKFSFQF